MIDPDRLLQQAIRISELETHLKQCIRAHQQLCLVVAIAAGGEFRLTKDDYAQAQGMVLEYGEDPVTGEFVYRATEAARVT